MKIGFTGTREGMSDDQKCEFLKLTKGATEFHHGDCIGGDEESDALIRIVKGVIVHIHPPDDPKLRAFCYKKEQGDIIWSTDSYINRNHTIVDKTEILIAAPLTNKEEVRSGTWATIRYARSIGRETWILER